MKQISNFILFFFFLANAVAQQDTSLLLKEVEIVATAIRTQAIGAQKEEWTTEVLQRLSASNISDLLTREGGVFIKNYGLGSLATSSLRGGSAGHTLVLWNGLPLQSPMLGLLDLSLLPLQIAEEVSLQKGGNSALWGSGAIGGLVGLNNHADFSNAINLNAKSEIGSFGRFQQQLQIAFGNSKFQSVTKLNHHQAENNFSYTISPKLPKREQPNARFLQQNLLQDFYWKINERHRIAMHYWRQNADRQIPPTNAQVRSEARQEDLANRLLLDWQFTGKNHLLKSKIAWIKEELNYFDDLIGLASPSQFNTLMGEITTQWNWKQKHQFSLGSTQFFTKARTTNYPNAAEEQRFALFGIHQFQHKEWAIQSSLRQEIVNGNSVPLVPNIGINYQVNPNLNAKLKISKNYRLPTLNDRYWKPGGNENLKAENGWSQEVSASQNFRIGAIQMDYSPTLFNRNIDNWILWSIQEGQSFWSANNIAKVWSRGLEQRLNLFHEGINWKFKLALGYDYIRSTNQVALENPRIEKGTQLLYTPHYQSFANLSIHYKNYNLTYQHSFVGESQGINEAIPNYEIANLSFQYELNRGAWNGRFFFHTYNLWNTNYLIVERRPMPGIHFSTGINIIFQKINN